MDEIAVRVLKRDARTAANCNYLQKAAAVSQHESSRKRTFREPWLHVAVGGIRSKRFYPSESDSLTSLFSVIASVLSDATEPLSRCARVYQVARP